MKILPALVLAAACGWASAQEGDPLKSAACGQALAALQAARASGAEAAGVRPVQDRAALACLGGGNPPQRSARVLQAPIAVPPPVIVPPAPLPPSLIAPSLPPPPLAIPRPPQVTHCDAGGCWASDGNTLRHVGPNLAGPQGLCVQQGGLVHCP